MRSPVALSTLPAARVDPLIDVFTIPIMSVQKTAGRLSVSSLWPRRNFAHGPLKTPGDDFLHEGVGCLPVAQVTVASDANKFHHNLHRPRHIVVCSEEVTSATCVASFCLHFQRLCSLGAYMKGPKNFLLALCLTLQLSRVPRPHR